MATTYLQRTESAGNRRTFTWSAWIKRSKLGASQFLAACSHSSSDESYFFFNGGDQLIWQSSAGNQGDVRTNRVFRDTNAWYHIVLAVDTTQATASNRIRFYVNGVEETSFSNASYPNQDTQLYWNVGGTYYPRIGRRHAASDYFDGLMSHIIHVDGTQLTPSTFGETDATTGEWKIKTNLSPTWGTNGYWILKDGNSVTDQSGQNNNWTVQGGTLTKTEDNPSNVFATLNTLTTFGGNSNPVVERGNTVLNTSGNNSNKGLFLSTLGMTQGSGKFYCEIKANDVTRFSAGVCNKNVFLSSSAPDSQTNQAAITYYYDGTLYYDNNGTVSGGVSLSNNDILGIALDMENYRLFFHKNGTYINSGDPTSSTGNVLTFTNAAQYVQNHGEMFFFVADTSTSGQAISSVNFGNGYFDTTAVSSAGTNASNNGIFEYDVPTGYTALSTKGLNL